MKYDFYINITISVKDLNANEIRRTSVNKEFPFKDINFDF